MQYYPSLIPGIKAILHMPPTSDSQLYRGKAMECIGLIAEVVGFQTFAPDSIEVMSLLIQALHCDVDQEITFDYILPACARISKGLGSNFLQYMPHIMDIVLVGANQKINVSMTDIGEDEEEEIECDDSEESTIVNLGAGKRTRITVNSSSVQQKKQASRLIFEFTSNMKTSFFQSGYLQKTLDSNINLMQEKYASDIKSSAILSLPKIIDIYIYNTIITKSISQSDCLQVLSYCIDTLCCSLESESNISIQLCLSETLRDILSACYQTGVSIEDQNTDLNQQVECCKLCPIVSIDLHKMSSITTIILKVLKETFEIRMKKIMLFYGNEKHDESDADQLNEMLEEYDDVLRTLSDVIGQLLKLDIHAKMYLNNIFLPTVLPLYLPFLNSTSDTFTYGQEILEIMSICLIDDVLEFYGKEYLTNPLIANLVNQVIPLFQKNFLHDDSFLRQSSIYGMIQICRNIPSIFSQFISSIVPIIIQLVQVSDAKDDDNIGITENMLIILGNICFFPEYQQVLEEAVGSEAVEQVIGLTLLPLLPLQSDETSCKVFHDRLFSYLLHHQSLLCKYHSQVLRIIGEILDINAQDTSSQFGIASNDKYSVTHNLTNLQMKGILQYLKSNISMDEWNQGIKSSRVLAFLS